MSETEPQAYEAPSIEVVGTLHESTLNRNKGLGKPNDGDFFGGKSEYTISTFS